MGDSITEKLEMIERMLLEIREKPQGRPAVSDPCKVTCGGVETSLIDPSDKFSGLQVRLREADNGYGVGGLSWSEASSLIEVLQRYIAREA